MAMVAFTGCGGGDEKGSPAAGGASGATKLTVAYLPSVQFAPLFLADKLGYYEDAGLDVELKRVTQGTTLVPSLLKGEVQGSVTSWGALGLSKAAGLPLVGTNTFDIAPTDTTRDAVQFAVLKSSATKRLEDLDGKTIGVNATKNFAELSVIEALRKSGSKAKYVAIPFPNMGAALKAGTVDAIVLTEPFLSQLGDEAPIRELGGGNTEYMPGLPITAFMMTKEFIAKNEATARAFMEATDKATAYAAEHPDAVRDVFPAVAGVSADVAQKAKLPQYAEAIDVAKLDEQSRLMKENGFAKEATDMGAVVADIAAAKVTGGR
ncbi:MAG: ABC transporter substrate-binding protein [Solirubrobacteraceae bacterium]